MHNRAVEPVSMGSVLDHFLILYHDPLGVTTLKAQPHPRAETCCTISGQQWASRKQTSALQWDAGTMGVSPSSPPQWISTGSAIRISIASHAIKGSAPLRLEIDRQGSTSAISVTIPCHPTLCHEFFQMLLHMRAFPKFIKCLTTYADILNLL